MTQIFLRDGKVVLCNSAPTTCPVPCGLQVSWTTCNNRTFSSTLTGNADYEPALDVLSVNNCWYGEYLAAQQNVDLYWLVANATPEEIQEPGGGYEIPVPDLEDPAEGVCRFVWRIFTGRGNFYMTLGDLTTAPTTSTPTACSLDTDIYSRYAWLGYADVTKCTGQVLASGIVADNDYDFSGWPINDPLGCACNYTDATCEAFAPAFSVGDYFSPDCCT